MPTSPGPVVEDVLREHLELRAAEVSPLPAPVEAVLARGRRRQRERIGVAATVITVCALLLGLGVAVRPGSGDGSGPAGKPWKAEWTLTDVPTAGDRAGDAGWLRDATRRAAALTGGATGHVVFAGRLGDDGLTGLVIATDPDHVRALSSPDGSAAGLRPLELDVNVMSGPGRTTDIREVSVSFAGAHGDRYYVVVPLAPFDTMRVSAGTDVQPGAATARRTWIEAAKHGNAAWGRLPAATLQAPNVEVDGRPARMFLAAQVPTTQAELKAAVTRILDTWPTWPKPPAEMVPLALYDVTHLVALSTAEIEPIFTGKLPPGGSAHLVFAIRLPNGARLQVGAVVGGGAGTSGMAVHLLPGPGAPVIWTSGFGSVHVVIPGASRVALVSTREEPCLGHPRQLAAGRPDEHGVTTLELPLTTRCVETNTLGPAVTVIGYDASGREVGRGPLGPDPHVALW